MATIEEICEVISAKQQISYDCPSGNHVAGERLGNPHIVFITKGGEEVVLIWKLRGVQTDPSRPLPSWRNYKLRDIQILRTLEEFSPESSFNPNAPIYKRTICSV